MTRFFFALEAQHKKIEYVVVDDLVVNNENNYRTVVLKNEETGILEIRKLVNTSPIEECWTYLPSKEKWIEIGKGEELEQEVDGQYFTKIKLDALLIEKLMAENDNLIVYHFHPSQSSFLNNKIEKRKDACRPMNKEEIEEERTGFLVKRAYPSDADVMCMIGNSMDFYEKQPVGNITFKIGSHYGVTEYSLTDEGRAYFRTDDSEEFLKRIMRVNTAVYFSRGTQEQTSKQSIDTCSRTKMNSKQKRNRASRVKVSHSPKTDPLCRILKSVKAMSNKYLRITFTPYEQHEHTL